jgi:hypothetical protein
MQPTDVQANTIAQVREQLSGTLRMNDGKGGVRTFNVPISGVTFMLDTDPNAILISVRKTRSVRIAFNAGLDLYDVRISDFARGGCSIVAEKDYSGVYFDTLGELVKSPRLRKVGA